MKPGTVGSNASEQGRYLLARFLCRNGDNQIVVAKAGGIEAVVAAMCAHSSNADVQCNGCKSLINIAVNTETQVQAAKAGAIGTVIRAMRSNPSRVDLLQFACWALENIVGHTENCFLFATAGGIETVISAMMSNSSSEELQLHGINVLGRIDVWLRVIVYLSSLVELRPYSLACMLT